MVEYVKERMKRSSIFPDSSAELLSVTGCLTSSLVETRSKRGLSVLTAVDFHSTDFIASGGSGPIFRSAKRQKVKEEPC